MPTHSGTYIEVLDQFLREEFDDYFDTLPYEFPSIPFSGRPTKPAWYYRLRFWFQRLWRLRWR